jgi:16S rRNA G1207 methylase RsmC
MIDDRIRGRLDRLKRYPDDSQWTGLRPFDAADELLLKDLIPRVKSNSRVLVLNDAFGAIRSGLDEGEVVSYTDSAVSAEGLRINLGFQSLNDFSKINGAFDVLIFRVPKNLSYFEDQLIRVRAMLKPNAVVVGGAMLKHLSKSAFQILEKVIGPVRTSLAEKKARLLYAEVNRPQMSSVFPREVMIEGYSIPFLHDSNLFSREGLDIGTRFFLESIPTDWNGVILDLGCANGILGITAKLRNPGSKIIYTDDSAQAVECSIKNHERFFNEKPEAKWMNCYERGEALSLDYVLCNPPFHQQHVVGDFIARQMFMDSKRALKTGGKIRVVGNSHLGYPALLRRVFGNVTVIAVDHKFTVMESQKLDQR